MTATSSSRSTARLAIFSRLRRRRNGNVEQEETELLVPDLQRDAGAEEHWGRESAYGLKDSQSLFDHQPRPSSSRNSTDKGRPHDDEIRSIIFNLPPTVAPDTHANEDSVQRPELQPGHLLPQPDLQTSPSPGRLQGPSTTFSFLSLSQVSSPEAPSTMLDSMTFSNLDSGMDEIMSMSMTSGGGGYESTDFSNVSSPQSRGHQALSSPPTGDAQAGAGGASTSGGLGLSTVGDVGMSYIAPVRRPRSVISLSESDGEGASDWEAVSVARST